MMEFLSVLWFFLIFVLIAGYFVLDGFDLGIGVLSPFIAKNDEERAVLRRAIGPVWDGNEVWLLTAGGALFALHAAHAHRNIMVFIYIAPHHHRQTGVPLGGHPRLLNGQ